jgi:aconitase B
VAKQGKKNIFSGRILEIEGLPDLKVEQASNCPTPRPSVRPPVARCA